VAAMKLRLIYAFKPLKWTNIGAITLYPFIFFSMSKEEARESRILHHEMVHVAQIRSYGWLIFYASYLLGFIANFIAFKNWNTAYRFIVFEREAYSNQDSTWMLVNLPEEER
jgi:hypothetical protein